ncbi:MAG: excinuclease ABC subunit UvrA [Flavobacteriales bacterium]
MKQKFIEVKGAEVHNLKKVDVKIPQNKFVVITGLSGSGKSSLAFDTLYAEGQRRYVESLSSYARQFLGRFDKPKVEYIKGIAPAIAIEQKVVSRNSRSTIGSVTEIYDYLKLLFVRTGKTISPVSGREVKKHTTTDVINFIKTRTVGEKLVVAAAIIFPQDRSEEKHRELLMQQGYTRIYDGQSFINLDGAKLEHPLREYYLLIDRLKISEEDEELQRLGDSADLAFYEGRGECLLFFPDSEEKVSFNNRFELDGMLFEEPNIHFFNFNNPVGACKRCEGFGKVIGIDEDLVIPDKSKSVYDNAVAAWRGEKMSEWKDQLIYAADKVKFPVHKPIHELSALQYAQLWDGTKYFSGLNEFFEHVESQTYKIQYRVMLSRYRGRTKCPECNGSRLRKDAGYVHVGGEPITHLLSTTIEECIEFFKNLKLSERDQKISERLLVEITNRLDYLDKVGLNYLTLDRPSSTLSGGESQRVNLATNLGSSLVGSMYILDEPSIGLHPRDTENLISVLKKLQSIGNTVIVVEHDEDIMRVSDHIIDMGPMAGTFGGEVVFEGSNAELQRAKNSLTADYLTEKKEIEIPKKRRKWKDRVVVKGARQFNLKNIDVEFPLRVLTAVTGVSGSGKSTLVSEVLYPALKRHLGEYTEKNGEFDGLEGDVNTIKQVEYIDQNPIGKSSRSNPVTYIKAYDDIRALFASQSLAKTRGFKPSHFSFNVPGGRCETCEGEGEVTISMQFMADVKLKCESCNGNKFKDEVLDIKYEKNSIADVLNMTIDDAVSFFQGVKKETVINRLLKKLLPLQEVGLGYVALGQSSSTLSGGEAQRIKLASFLAKSTPQHTLFIFDEPTTGLHFHDISKLLKSFEALIKQGHTIILIEHNMDVVKCADWVIDIGPDGGKRGGAVVAYGTPENVSKSKNSVTAGYLKQRLK